MMHNVFIDRESVNSSVIYTQISMVDVQNQQEIKVVWVVHTEEVEFVDLCDVHVI